MRHCPICWSHRRILLTVGRISWWWHHKVLKEPEPDFTEAVFNIIPSLFSAMVSMELGKEIAKECDKAIIESKKKKLNEKKNGLEKKSKKM
jgi:hypothetical protein